MAEKIQLDLIGITYNQIESGVYAVVLQQHGGTRRIPIVIGVAEAQSIECRLQSVITPRPLTHDLMATILNTFGMTLREVWLHRLPSGVFAADLHLSDGTREVTIDSRSSDAIALAIRTGSPIYTSPEVLQEAGFEPGQAEGGKAAQSGHASTVADITKMSVPELRKEMDRAVAAEDYERAALIKKEIDSRGGSAEQK